MPGGAKGMGGRATAGIPTNPHGNAEEEIVKDW
jgi:hypothetical protein